MNATDVKRWWRGRGFGVHSPFAYSFITDTLHCPAPYRYYAYDRLKELWERAPRRERMPLRRVLAIYRVGVRFASVELRSGDACGLAAAALAMAAGADGSRAGGRVSVWCDVAAADAGWRGALAAMDSGMTFTDGHLGVIVADSGLPLQHFEVSI